MLIVPISWSLHDCHRRGTYRFVGGRTWEGTARREALEDYDNEAFFTTEEEEEDEVEEEEILYDNDNVDDDERLSDLCVQILGYVC